MRSRLCEASCPSSTAAVIEPVVPDLRPTQVVRTIVYQVIPQTKCEQPVPQWASHPLTYVLISLVLVIFLLTLGTCTFAVFHRCNAKTKAALVAAVKVERDANSRNIETVKSNHNAETANWLLYSDWMDRHRVELLNTIQDLEKQKTQLVDDMTRLSEQVEIRNQKSEKTAVLEANLQLTGEVKSLESKCNQPSAELINLRKSEQRLTAENKALSQNLKKVQARETDLISENEKLLKSKSQHENYKSILTSRNADLNRDNEKLTDKNTELTDKNTILSQHLSKAEAYIQKLTQYNYDWSMKCSQLEVIQANLGKENQDLAQQVSDSKEREAALKTEVDARMEQLTQSKESEKIAKEEKEQIQTRLNAAQIEISQQLSAYAALKEKMESTKAQLTDTRMEHDTATKSCAAAEYYLSDTREAFDHERKKHEAKITNFEKETVQRLKEAQNVKTESNKSRSEPQCANDKITSLKNDLEAAEGRSATLSPTNSAIEQCLNNTKEQLGTASEERSRLGVENAALTAAQTGREETAQEVTQDASATTQNCNSIKAQYNQAARKCKDLAHRVRQMARALLQKDKKQLLNVIPDIFDDFVSSDENDTLMSEMEIILEKQLKPWRTSLKRRSIRFEGLGHELKTLAERMFVESGDSPTQTQAEGEDAQPTQDDAAIEAEEEETLDDVFGEENPDDDADNENTTEPSTGKKRRRRRKNCRRPQRPNEHSTDNDTSSQGASYAATI